MTDWTDYQDEISDAISDSMDMDWSANDGARAVVAWLNEHRPISTTPRVTVPVEDLIDIVEGIGGIQHGTWRDEHGMRLKDTPAWVAFYTAARLSAAPAPEGGAVDGAEENAETSAGCLTRAIDLIAKGLYLARGGTEGAYRVEGGDGPSVYGEGKVHRRINEVRGEAYRVVMAWRKADPFALATREEAPAEAGEIGAEYDAAAHCVTLAECPPGLFLWNGTLGFKSEYGAMEPVGISPHHQQWKVGNRADAYCADSGEYFWGGTSNHDDRAKLLVYPVSADAVAMVASHGPSALRAQPQAREGGGQ